MISSLRMRPYPPRPWLVATLFLLLPGLAAADDFQKNADSLRTASDFRVRTQAALALGASRDRRAVVPLCQGVADGNRVVRIASATALSRLAQGGDGCIRRQLEAEADQQVKVALEKALSKLLGEGGAEPAIAAATRLYIAIDRLSGPERLNGPVRAAFVRGVGGSGEVAIAPAGETVGQATDLLKKYAAARGFMLAPRAAKPTYEGDQLKVKLSVAILSYPDKAIVGSFTQNLAMAGVTSKDPKAEEELVIAAAESAMRKFLQIAPSLDL
jgi:hypothetical protein